jgi:hypothetical protein
MVPNLFFYQLVLVALVWLCFMLHWAWPSGCATAPLIPFQPTPPRPKRRREPKPFAGVTTKPHCDACAHAGELRPPARWPPRIVTTRGRRREIDTSRHSAPADCAYRGWIGWGNPAPMAIRVAVLAATALRCLSPYFLETLGTLFHGKRASVELIVRVIACLAEGRHPGHGAGVRGHPNTVLQVARGGGGALRAFSQHVCMTCGPAGTAGRALCSSVQSRTARSAGRSDRRHQRSPGGSGWRWTPSKLLLALDAGARTLAWPNAWSIVARSLGPDCAPVLTDGFRAYMTALLTHYGDGAPPRRRSQAVPEAALDAAAQLLYAQVIRPCADGVWSV